MKSYEKIAKILRADRDTIRLLEERLSAATGKKNVLDKITEENEAMIRKRLDFLGLDRQTTAKELYDALISKIESDDHRLFETLGGPKKESSEDQQKILDIAKNLAGQPKGFFLKKNKAEELLKNQPPQKIISSLGYRDAEELIQKEDLWEIFSGLRFLEDADWLNNEFFKQYENLTPADFEEREIIVKSLGPQWASAAQSFVKKKYHNISHLKELGVVFVIPVPLGISGELMRNFSLILHYLNEVLFYSEILKKLAGDEKTFSKNLISLLRGDVVDKKLIPSDKSQWLIIQRYLAKDDENDWRLFKPHVNPEALHWEKAERMLVKAGEALNDFSIDLAFWQNLNWVGDFFRTESGVEILVSFNLVDTVMSLVKEKELIKYLLEHGCIFEREGKSHTLFHNPKTKKSATVPRHKEINTFTARGICKDLEIDIIEKR